MAVPIVTGLPPGTSTVGLAADDAMTLLAGASGPDLCDGMSDANDDRFSDGTASEIINDVVPHASAATWLQQASCAAAALPGEETDVDPWIAGIRKQCLSLRSLSNT